MPPHLKGLVNPSQKMKNLNWTKIPHLKVEGTIWGSQQLKTLLDLPFNELEELFCTVAPEPKKAAPKEGEQSKKKEKKVVTIIDGKRAQNLGSKYYIIY